MLVLVVNDRDRARRTATVEEQRCRHTQRTFVFNRVPSHELRPNVALGNTNRKNTARC